jgi:rhodanese-related sulfurtransferase
VKELTPQQVEQLLKNGKKIQVIDVRETTEVAVGKIPGADNIPLGLLEFRKQDLDKTVEYIMVCRSGGRSARATEYLTSQGYQAVNMIGGMLAWEGNIESS